MNCNFIFFMSSNSKKLRCCCQFGFAHGVHPENSLGYLFMASGMVYVHISMKVLKLLAVQGVVELGLACNRKLMAFQNGGFPEFIESYYMLESIHLSGISTANESLHEILEFKFRNMGNEDFERGSMALF